MNASIQPSQMPLCQHRSTLNGKLGQQYLLQIPQICQASKHAHQLQWNCKPRDNCKHLNWCTLPHPPNTNCHPHRTLGDRKLFNCTPPLCRLINKLLNLYRTCDALRRSSGKQPAFGPNRPLALMKVVFILLETMARLSSPKKRKSENGLSLTNKTTFRLGTWEPSERSRAHVHPTNQII